MRVTRDGNPIELTPTEFHLLATLARHAGRVFTRAQLLESDEAFDRAIDSHIKNLRRKLGARDYIATVYGIGYKFIDE
jgi:DNA-binding response OmpR family regulator